METTTTTTTIKPAFEPDGVTLPLARILPMKRVDSDETKSGTLRRLMSSIQEVGLIEPLVVYPQGPGKDANYSLLDGHLRLEAMKKLGWATAACLISTEDEAYTYNHKVNIVPPLQEHFMIRKALENGVSEHRIAAVLNIDVARIRQKRDLLKGICEEAVELLKNKGPSHDALRELRKVKPLRQIEIAELMVRSYNFTAGYVKCLLAATADDMLVDPHRPKAPRAMKAEDLASVEREMEALEQNFLALDETHGRNVLDLTLATTYLRKLMDNAAVARFLSAHHTELCGEFRKLVEVTTLDREA